ncbi:MAG: membrane protease YdiL (CAAX protease family) [Pirellulaceae bacterium]|jgi:membrane protease YdiL (CAAX protease family)
MSNKESSSWDGYWKESQRPLVSLLFILPMLTVYEVGVLMGHTQHRNGADAILRNSLSFAGFGQYFLLPLLTCGILLGWHHMSREKWKFTWSVFYGMLLESMVFGCLLLMVGQLVMRVFTNSIVLLSLQAQFGKFVSYLGAGIYEELLFRLMLIPIVLGLLSLTGMKQAKWRMTTAVVLTSIIFSLAHYKFDFALFNLHVANTIGDSFDWPSFAFRFLAGVFFAVLFLKRGYGITCGTHALFDVCTLFLEPR